MKKRFVGIVTFIVALSMIFNFVGCDQQANPVQPSDPKPIGFKITLPSANPERAGYYTQDDASLYRVELEKDDEDYAMQEGGPGDTLIFTVEDEGSYDIYVTAYNEDGNVIAEGYASKEISFGDGLVEVTIKLIPYEKPEDDPQDPSDPIDPPVTDKVDLSIQIVWGQPGVITFDLNGGNVNGDTSNIEGDFSQEPPVPTKDGYILKGWTLSLDGDDFFAYYNEYGELVTDNYDLVEEMFYSGQDFTLYAKWLEIKYEAEPGKLYMIPYGDWVTGKEAYACWFWGDFQEGFWVPMTPKESDENNIKGLYEVTIPEGVDNVIFVAYDKTKELDWDAKLCQTSDFKIPTSNAVLYDTSRGCFVTPDGVVEEATSKSINDLTYFYGNMTDWNLPEKLVDGSFTFYAIGGDSFKFLASAWDVLEAGGVRVDALDSKIELQTAESGLDYITFNPGVLTVNAEYKVTLIIEDEKAFVKVEETGNAYPPSDEETKGFYRLTHITGSFADWVPNAYVLDENNSFIYESDGNEHLFKFSAGGWDFSIGNVCIDGVGTFELNSGGIADISGNGKILLPAGTYKITLEVLTEDSANVNVEAVEIPDTTDKIVLTVWESAGGPEYFIRQAGAAFSEKNPDVVIKFVNVESNDASNQIVLDGPAGVGADLFAAQHDQLGKLVSGNHINSVSLSNETEASLLDSGRQAITYDGKTWGYPVSLETYALYYNKDLISEDEVPTTWEELIDWTAEFNANNPGKQGFMMDVANAYYSILFTTANGNRLFGKSGEDYSSSYLNTDDAIKGMEIYQELSDVIGLPAADFTGANVDMQFSSGNAAMIISGPWNLGNYENAGINYGVTTLPALPGESTPAASFVGARCMFVSAYSKHPETAAAFAEFLLSEEMQALRYELTNGALPSIKIELEDENATAFLEQLDYAFPNAGGSIYG